MKSASTNTFNDGLVRDLNELTTPDKVMTYCLNGTLVTFNGNEFSLQNDMGNARIGTAYLPDGYVPVGMKEYGGIIYVASYNPQTKKGQIGSFPSPKRLFLDNSGKSSIILNDTIIEWRPVGETVTTNYPFIKNDFYGGEITDDILHNGDWFALTSNIGDSYNDLINNGVLTIDLAVKTDNRLIPIEKMLTGIPFTNKTGDLQTSAIQIITDADYENINVFNSKYSGSLYYILNYRTLEDWNISTQVEKGKDKFILTYTPNYIIYNDNKDKIKFGGAVYENLNDSSKYTDVSKSNNDPIILTQTVPKDSSINGYLIPYTNYGVLERLKLAVNYTYGELDDGLDKLTEYYYEYKQGSIPEEDYIYLRIGYQYLSWTDDVFSGLRLKLYDLDYPDVYNKILTETGEPKEKTPILTLDINSSEGIFNRSEILYFGNGFIENKIYIIEIYTVINNTEYLKSIKTMYTSPIINTIGYNDYTLGINVQTNNSYKLNEEETYYLTQDKNIDYYIEENKSPEYKDTEVSIDSIRKLLNENKQPITYIKHTDKYTLNSDISYSSYINNNTYSYNELCVNIDPTIIYTSSIQETSKEVPIDKDTSIIEDNILTLTQYKYIYSSINIGNFNGSITVLRRAFNPLGTENSDIRTRMVANPTSYLTGDDRTTYNEAIDITRCDRVIRIFGLHDSGHADIVQGKAGGNIQGFNNLTDSCNYLSQNNEQATMCFGFSYLKQDEDDGNPYSKIYDGTGINSGSADGKRGITPNENFFRFNNRPYNSSGYDGCINYQGAADRNNQAITYHNDYYYEFVALKTYDPIDYSDGNKSPNNWAVIDLFRYGKESSSRGSREILYDSYLCSSAYAAYIYFSQILVPVKINYSNEKVNIVGDITEDNSNTNVNVKISLGDQNTIIKYNNKNYNDIITKWRENNDSNNDTKFITYNLDNNISFTITNKCDILSSANYVYTLGKEPFKPNLDIPDTEQIYLLNLGDNDSTKLTNLLNYPTIIDDISLVKDIKMVNGEVVDDPEIVAFNQKALPGNTGPTPGMKNVTSVKLSYLRDWLVPESSYTSNVGDFNPLYIRLGTAGLGTTSAVKQILYSKDSNPNSDEDHQENGPLFINFGFGEDSDYIAKIYS